MVGWSSSASRSGFRYSRRPPSGLWRLEVAVARKPGGLAGLLSSGVPMGGHGGHGPSLNALRGPLRPRNIFFQTMDKTFTRKKKCISKFHSQGRSQAGRLGGGNVAKGPLSSLGGPVYKHVIYHSIIIYQHLNIE